MADNSLNESFPYINYVRKGIDFLEVQKIHLSKAKSLINIALGDDFMNQLNEDKYNYLYVVSDLIGKIRILNEKSILLLEKIKQRLTTAE